MTKKLKLSSTRQKWVKERNAATLKGDPLSYPAAVSAKYQKTLQSLAATMAEDYRRQLHKVWNSLGDQIGYGVATTDATLASQVRMTLSRLGRKWERVFSERSREITNRMISSVNNSSTSAVKQSLKQLSGGVTIPVPELPGALKESITASVNWNVSLIRNIQTKFAQEVEADMMQAIQGQGKTTADVFERLLKVDGMTQRRAKTIADDQVRKVTSAMNSARVQAAGVTQFRWQHSGGGAEPRELHLKLSGKIFRYDDPPVIDEKTGERGLPGQLINCRCIAIPVIQFD